MNQPLSGLAAASLRPVIATTLLLLGSLGSAQGLDLRSLPDFTTLVEMSAPAVVNISTTQKAAARTPPKLPPGLEVPEGSDDSQTYDFLRRFFGERYGEGGGEGGGEGEGGGPPPSQRDGQSLGSGFIFAEDGYIISNNHVVSGADEVVVRLADRREFVAEVVGTDERSDIAVLKIDASGLPTVPLGRDYNLRVGEWVLAIGAPFGFDHSVTAGIVSAKGRSLPSESYVPFIQTDVAINPGNSGGPLFNLRGEVVGVNAQIFSRTGGFMGLSFAIPIDVAMDVADQLRDGGRVSRGWLGVLIQDVTRERAASHSMEKPSGAFIARVLDESPAARAGFESGDIVLSFNGREVGRSSELPPIVGRTPVGRKVPVEVMRNGERIELEVLTAELPDEKDLRVAAAPPGTGADVAELGVRVADISDEQRRAAGVEDGGVLVSEVLGEDTRKAGVRRGDIIVRLDNKVVSDAAAFAAAAEQLPGGKAVSIIVQRNGKPQFFALRTP